MTTPTTLRATFQLTAAIDAGSRTISGLALPYGVVGMTSIGPVTVEAGAIELPEDLSRVKLFNEHDRNTPVGYLESADDQADGLTLSFHIGATPAGDAAILEASERLRDGLSVELDLLTFDDTETIVTAGMLRGCGLVTVPAWDEARVAAVAASHHPEEGTQTMTTPTLPDAAAPQPAEAGPSAAAAAAPGSQLAAAAPQGLQATAPGAIVIERPRDLYTRLAAAYSTERGAQLQSTLADLTAALSDITGTGTTDMGPAQFVGQLWAGVAYQRKVVPLLNTSKPLTSYNIVGWKWADKPEVNDWAGDKAAVPSDTASTDPVTVAAERLAGAHDIDRKYRDFNDVDFFQAYYEAMSESYAIKSDAKAVAKLLAGATDLTATRVGIAAAIAEGVQAIGDATNAASTFVLANSGDMLDWLLPLTSFDVGAFWTLLGIDPERIVTHSGVTAGHVVVGTSASVEFRELPGSPIRAEAIDMTKGGVDAGVFGYYAYLQHAAAGVQDVTINAGP